MKPDRRRKIKKAAFDISKKKFFAVAAAISLTVGFFNDKMDVFDQTRKS